MPQEVVCYGKIPTHGDFVSINASAPVLRRLDDWIRGGLYLRKVRGGSHADGASAHSSRYGFCFTDPNSNNTLVGVFQMSRDRAGRQFPFFIATSARPGAVPFASLPLRLDPFLDEASSLCREAIDDEIHYSDVVDRVREMSAPQLDTPISGFRDPGARTTLRVLFEGLWGDFNDERKYRVFENLHGVLAVLDADTISKFSLGLRFPLRRGMAASDVAFWMQVALSRVDVPANPSAFWSLGRVAGGRDFLLMFYRQPGSSIFNYLLKPDVDEEAVYDLESFAPGSDSGEPTMETIPTPPLLDNGDLTVAAFLQQFLTRPSAQ